MPRRTCRDEKGELCWKVENDRSWGQKKHDHVKRWHPEERAQLAARKRSVVFEVIAPSEKAEGAEFAWVCPIPGCGHGIMQPLSVGCSSTERSAPLDARRAHAKSICVAFWNGAVFGAR